MSTREVSIPARERMHKARIEVHQNPETVAVTCRFVDHEGKPADVENAKLEVTRDGKTTRVDLLDESKGLYTGAFDAERGAYDLRLTSDGQCATRAERFVWVSG